MCLLFLLRVNNLQNYTGMIKNKNERKKTIILPFSNCAEHPTTALKAMNTETK